MGLRTDVPGGTAADDPNAADSREGGSRPHGTLATFRRVLRQPAVRRVLPGMLISAIGDGMSVVAVAWLAVEIAPAGRTGVWTGLAVAAYTLPATVGAVVLGRLVRGFGGAALLAVDATVRAVALGTIAVLAITDSLSPAGYVALLAASSLLHAWGMAGTYTLIAEVLPEEDRVVGNALVSIFAQAAIVIGPALAGILAAVVGAGAVIGLDAASFAVLAASGWMIAARPRAAVPAPEETSSGWRTILGERRLVGLLVVTCAFFFLYGPVEVGLPVHVADELHGSPGLLGAFWAVFGVGAVIGGLAAGWLRHRPLWTVVIGIIIGWGVALLPIGLTDAIWPGLVGFAVGGVIYGPFTAICTALFQQSCPPAVLSRALAIRTALTAPSVALGTLLGGPVVGAIGGRQTLLASALLTIALGIVVAVIIGLDRRAGRYDSSRAWSG